MDWLYSDGFDRLSVIGDQAPEGLALALPPAESVSGDVGGECGGDREVDRDREGGGDGDGGGKGDGEGEREALEVGLSTMV